MGTNRLAMVSSLVAKASKPVTDKLQRVLNVTVGIVSYTHKYDRAWRGLSTHLLYTELHWLDVPERVQHELIETVHCCLQSKAPAYLVGVLLSNF